MRQLITKFYYRNYDLDLFCADNIVVESGAVRLVHWLSDAQHLVDKFMLRVGRVKSACLLVVSLYNYDAAEPLTMYVKQYMLV